ncbi:hypothetical protein D3C84_1250940 [compost metagenome]
MYTSFSSWVRKSRCWTEPPRSRIEDQTVSAFLAFSARSFSRYGFLIEKLPDSVLCV